MNTGTFDGYTAEQLQEAHDWWNGHDVSLPSPYHQPRLYLSYMMIYHTLVKPGLEEDDGVVPDQEESDQQSASERSSEGQQHDTGHQDESGAAADDS